MKKIVSLLLVLVMMLGLVACGTEKPAETTGAPVETTAAPVETTAPAETDAPTEAALVELGLTPEQAKLLLGKL